jgi:hypothetical protein
MSPLEKASNIAVIIAAGAIAVTAVYDRVVRPVPFGATPSDTFAKQYKGKPMPLPGFQQGMAPATLVLFVSKNCHFCAESVPFYQRLAAVRSASSGRLRIIASVPQALETEAEAREYFSEKEITLDGAQPAPFRLIGVTATPTLALVGDRGIVTDVWVGKLPPEKEQEVVSRIAAICGGCVTGVSEQ